MVVNYYLLAFGAATAHFDTISVEDLSEAVVFRKMFIK